jgi:hypothetical protein
MIVLLLGDTNGGRDNFYNYVCKKTPGIIWLNNSITFLFHNNLIVYFGGPVPYLPPNMETITWSGDHDETLERIYKKLFIDS